MSDFSISQFITSALEGTAIANIATSVTSASANVNGFLVVVNGVIHSFHIDFASALQDVGTLLSPVAGTKIEVTPVAFQLSGAHATTSPDVFTSTT